MKLSNFKKFDFRDGITKDWTLMPQIFFVNFSKFTEFCLVFGTLMPPVKFIFGEKSNFWNSMDEELKCLWEANSSDFWKINAFMQKQTSKLN